MKQARPHGFTEGSNEDTCADEEQTALDAVLEAAGSSSATSTPVSAGDRALIF